MGTKWQIIINKEIFHKETTRVAYAITCALKEYVKRHSPGSVRALVIEAMREDRRKIPYSKIAYVLR